MTRNSLVLWWARILALAVCVWLGLFALDALEPGKPLSATLTGFAVHLLPSALVLCIVIASWRRPLLGALAFVAVALGYAATVRFRVDWMLAISGPMLAVGLLFLWAWRNSHRLA